MSKIFSSYGADGGLEIATLGQVELLNGNNYRKWRNQVKFYLSMHQGMDYCLVEEKPGGLNDDSSEDDKWHFREWTRTNRLAKNVIRNTMSDIVRGSIEKPEDAIDFLDAIGEKFVASEKAEAARLSKKFYELKYDGSKNVRKHIIHLIELNAKLRDLRMGVSDAQIVHMALDSLPQTFSHLRTTYNASETKWDLNKLISVCVDEEDNIKKEAMPTTTVNLVENPKGKRNKFKPKKTTQFKTSGKTAESTKTEKSFKYKCYFCKKVGHMKKDCSGFKAWMIKKGFNKEEGSKDK